MFGILKKFLNEYTVSKIHIFDSDRTKWEAEIKKHIPAQLLPTYFGGELIPMNVIYHE